MAYLDRPAPAGYFIFPDLSVRHEGKYRLSFSLYEELKEQKDMDSETPQNVEIQKSAHVSHRLEVKSVPFIVFSAKKFPGLTESTALSRMVAEQGCRVRIRRDVRMRRRENKSSRDYDEYDEEAGFERSRATATPDAYGSGPQIGTPQAPQDIDRPRSVSNASNASYMPGRRPSMEQMGQGYQQPQQPQYSNPLTPQTSQGMYPPQQAPQWQQQQPQQQQQQPVNYMQPPPPSYPAQQSYQQANGQQQYNGFIPPQYPNYDQSQHMRHGSMEMPQQIPQPPAGPPANVMSAPPHQMQPQYQTAPAYGSVQNNYSRPQSNHAQVLQPLQIPHQSSAGAVQPVNASSGPYSAAPAQSPVMKPEITSPYQPQVSAEHMQHQDQQMGYYSAAPVAPPKFSHAPQPTGATKRTYSASFDTEHMDQPLRQGARPPMSNPEPKFPYGSDGLCDDDMSTPLDEANMSYRRADGTERRRRIPLPI
jgi:hypothetical protein